jgi:hypothetical protein
VGATALAKDALGGAARDGYANLKGLLRTRYPTVEIDRLEARPDSQARRASVEEDLTASGADRDSDLLALSQQVAATFQSISPDIAAEIGVNLQDVKVSRVQRSLGSMGLITGGGNILIEGVTNGVEPAEPWPQPGKLVNERAG